MCELGRIERDAADAERNLEPELVEKGGA